MNKKRFPTLMLNGAVAISVSIASPLSFSATIAINDFRDHAGSLPWVSGYQCTVRKATHLAVNRKKSEVPECTVSGDMLNDSEITIKLPPTTINLTSTLNLVSNQGKPNFENKATKIRFWGVHHPDGWYSVLSGQNQYQVMKIESGRVELENVWLYRGTKFDGNGGCLWTAGGSTDVRVKRSRFSYCKALRGGAISTSANKFVLEDAWIEKSIALDKAISDEGTGGGGLWMNSGTVIVKGTDGKLKEDDSAVPPVFEFDEATAVDYGVWSTYMNTLIPGPFQNQRRFTRFTDNSSLTHGGCITQAGGTLIGNSVYLVNCTAVALKNSLDQPIPYPSLGGAINSKQGKFELVTGVIENARTIGRGSAIRLGGAVQNAKVKRCSFISNFNYIWSGGWSNTEKYEQGGTIAVDASGSNYVNIWQNFIGANVAFSGSAIKLLSSGENTVISNNTIRYNGSNVRPVDHTDLVNSGYKLNLDSSNAPVSQPYSGAIFTYEKSRGTIAYNTFRQNYDSKSEIMVYYKNFTPGTLNIIGNLFHLSPSLEAACANSKSTADPTTSPPFYVFADNAESDSTPTCYSGTFDKNQTDFYTGTPSQYVYGPTGGIAYIYSNAPKNKLTYQPGNFGTKDQLNYVRKTEIGKTTVGAVDTFGTLAPPCVPTGC